MPKNPIRLTISQAANLFGISQKTVRRAIQEEVVSYVVVRGVYKINFESVLKWSQSRVKIKNKVDSKGIGQYVDKWKIKNKLYSPNPKTAENISEKSEEDKKPEKTG
ncbi:MAG: helix-turn-helix domain-containing protein [Candidatus Buchananbacteria bacterium]|jgi:excisionase family DNA binding protein